MKYLDAMVPIKTKLTNRYNQVNHSLEIDRLCHILDRTTSKHTHTQYQQSNPKINNQASLSQSTSSQSISTPSLAHHSPRLLPSSSPSSLLSTPTLSTSFNNSANSSTSFPSTTSLLNTPPQPAPETNIPSLTDWTIIESPPYEPIRQTSWQPSINGKPKTNQNRVSAHHHSKTSPFASSSFLSSNCKPTQRNPLVWPVELGNGQGQRMSVALNLDQPSSCSHDARLQDSQSRSYQSDLPGQHASQDTSHPRVTFRHQQTLYDLPDPANPNPSPHAQPSRPITHQPPSKPKKSPFSLGRFNISSEHLCGLNQSPTALPSSHSHTSPPASSTFKALLRPRRLSLSSPSSKPQSRESLGSWASVSVPASPPEEQSSPPSAPQTSSRSRRGSLGEASTWRWLKGLNLKPVGNSFKSHASANLYADLPSSADLPSLAPPAPIISAASARPAPNNRSRPTPPPIPPKQFRTEKSQIIFPSSSSDASPSSRPLRPMRCPNDLVGAFVAMAEPETQKGVELCGLLLGKLVCHSHTQLEKRSGKIN